ncbi:MAG: bifunctional DNA primase/polymerase [Thermomicrobiales bacterium]|nr:bifunctional DNA primase/polymerase [Thermomicrobiales bacterium]
MTSKLIIPQIPVHLQGTFTSLPTGPHSPQALAAIGLASARWQIVPLLINEKRIDASTGFRHGRKPHIPTREEVIDLWMQEPDRNVGIVPSPGTICVDLDSKHGADLSTLDALGLTHETLTERSRSGGYHCWYQLPRGFRASKSSTGNRRLPSGVDLLSSSSLVVSPWSQIDGSWYRYDTDIWTMARIPGDWPWLDLLEDSEAIRFGRITRSDREAARRLRHRLLERSEFRPRLKGLFGKNWQTALTALTPTSSGQSESHRDFAFAFCATHFLRDNPRAPQILVALLLDTGWPQSRFREHPKSDPNQYARSVVRRAISARTDKDLARLEALSDRYGLVHTGLAHQTRTPCYLASPDPDAASLDIGVGGKPTNVEIIADVIGMFGIKVQAFGDTEFLRSDGYIRVPCGDIAKICEVSPDTVTRALKLGEQRGWWVRSSERYRHDGAPRCDSLVKMVRT